MADLLLTKRAFAKLRNNEATKDLTLVCEGREFKVHRMIVDLHTDLLPTAPKDVYEEGVSLHEDAENRVEIVAECLVEVVEKMVDFFYEIDGYDDTISDADLPELKHTRPSTRMQMNAHVYVLAAKYKVNKAKDLKAVALAKFTEAAEESAKTGDAHEMLGAAYTIYRQIEVEDGGKKGQKGNWRALGVENKTPEIDRKISRRDYEVLNNTFLDMWLLGGNKLLANVKKHSDLTEWVRLMPEFMVDVLTRCTSPLDGSVMQFCANTECGRYERSTTPPNIIPKTFYCADRDHGCKGHKASAYVALGSRLIIKRE